METLEDLAPDYSIVAELGRAAEGTLQAFFMASSLAQLPDGVLVAAIGQGHYHPERGKGLDSVVVCNSHDGGETWQQVAELPHDSCEPVLHVHQSRLYMIITPNRLEYERGTNFPRGDNGRVWVAASDNAGGTWSKPELVIRSEIPYTSGGQGAMVERDGHLYLTLSNRYQSLAALRCDLDKGLLEPAAWTVSELTTMPIPEEVTHPMLTGYSGMRCLEGNVVEVSGRLLVIARTILNSGGTAGMGAVFEIVDQPGESFRLEFRLLHPIPGGQMKFHIRRDLQTGLYWMVSNQAVNPGYLVEDEAWLRARASNAYATDRRWLLLWYAVDALNWIPAGWVARTRKWTQSFSYPVMLIDGEDLLILSRTAKASKSQHDVDCTTFHRVHDFRALALAMAPVFEDADTEDQVVPSVEERERLH